MWKRKSNHVYIEANVESFLNQLTAKLPFNIVVTSATRTPTEQAKLMKQRIDNNKTLDSLYGDTEMAEAVTAVYPDLTQMADVIQNYVNEGRPPSKHLVDQAFDIRINDLSQFEKNMVWTEAKSLGAEPLDEGNHYHFEIPYKKKASESGGLIFGLGVVAVILILVNL